MNDTHGIGLAPWVFIELPTDALIPFLSATVTTSGSGNEYQKADHGGRMATVLHSPCRTHWSSGHVHHAGRPELTLERKETAPTDTPNDASHPTRVANKLTENVLSKFGK